MKTISITRIEFQNKRKKTYSLYDNDTFLAEINEDTLVHFAISNNTSFSKEKFDHILEHDTINSCLLQAYTYLQNRPYLRKELQRKLLNKQFTKEIIEKTIYKLEQNNYINDDDYIGMFIRDAIRQEKSGPQLIKKKLLEKGALQKDIERNMDELFPIVDQVKIASVILFKKHSRLTEKNILKRKLKLQQYGMSRGFTWNILENIINNLPYAE